MKMMPLLAVTLTVTLVAQILFRLGSDAPDRNETAIGDPIPDVAMEHVAMQHVMDETPGPSLAEVLEDTPGCDVVVLASVYCSHCRRYRLTWDGTYQAWADTLGIDIPAAWVFKEAPTLVRDFLGDGRLTNATPWSLGADAESSWARLGVFATPTTYLVDAAGIIQAGNLGPSLPPASETMRTCAAPRE